MTPEQDELNQKWGGMAFSYYVDNIIRWFKADMLRYTNEENMVRLRELQRLLNEHLT